MKCPACVDADLQMTERQGVEIDYCPKCRGVWLDRGELDKIIDRVATAPPGFAAAPAGAPPIAAIPVPPAPPQYPPQYAPPQYQQGYQRDDDSDYNYGAPGHPHRKKKRGFLGDMFDFD